MAVVTTSTRRRNTAIGVALAAVGARAGLKLIARRVHQRHDSDLDSLSALPEVIHHTVPTHDGGAVHVVEHGSGTRTVMVMHGVTLQWWVWSAVMRLLGDDCRVFAWDMRGHGESIPGSDGITLEAVGRDIATVIEHLELREVTLVGHSMGGMALGSFVAEGQHAISDRVAKLVFVATSAATLAPGAVRGGLGAFIGMIESVTKVHRIWPDLRYRWNPNDVSTAMIALAFGANATEKMVEDVRVMEREMNPTYLGESAISIARHDVRGRLRFVDQPVTVVVGTHDRLTPPIHSDTLVAQFENAKLVTLVDVGHQVMQEAPHQLVQQILD